MPTMSAPTAFLPGDGDVFIKHSRMFQSRSRMSRAQTNQPTQRVAKTPD